MADLKPCPFCGDEVPIREVDLVDGLWRHWIECGSLCEARGPLETTAEKAAESWNRRAATWDDLMALLDQHWPEDVFPPGDDPTRDAGARIVGLLRWVDRLKKELEAR